MQISYHIYYIINDVLCTKNHISSHDIGIHKKWFKVPQSTLLLTKKDCNGLRPVTKKGMNEGVGVCVQG